MITVDRNSDGRPEISRHAVYCHFRKWCRDGSFRRVWDSSISEAAPFKDLSALNFDGSRTAAKKGGESAARQGRKKAPATDIMTVTDENDHPAASADIIDGNHNDAYNLDLNLNKIFEDIKKTGLSLKNPFSMPTKALIHGSPGKKFFAGGTVPNIPENRRNRKCSKRGRRRLFNEDIYRRRFGHERIFAWIDKFRRLQVRFERKNLYFPGFHFIVFALINLRHFFS